MSFYLGIVDRAEDGSWGVVFPDLPGCTSAGRDMDDLYANSLEALRLWAQDAIVDGERLPTPRTHDAFVKEKAVYNAIKRAGATGCIIQVPLLLDEGRNVRANISIDAGLLGSIDAAAKQSGLTRSSFLASAAREKIASAHKRGA